MHIYFNINLFSLEANDFTILYWFCHTFLCIFKKRGEAFKTLKGGI